MEVKLKYRGRMISAQEVAFIQALIDKHPEASRRRLSAMRCEHWGWVQPNGPLRDRLWRSMMLELHRVGHIEPPPIRCRAPNNMTAHHRPKAVDSRPLRTTPAALQPLAIRQVRAQMEEPLLGAVVEVRPYLGYRQPVGEYRQYPVWANERPIACLSGSSAPRHLGPRERFIGWSAKARRQTIRFLVLPWVAVANLASHLLDRMAKPLAAHWERIYGHSVYYRESFVDPGRFRGTGYRATNGISLGLRLGLGKDARSKRANCPRKEILGYPLDRRLRTLRCELR